jgi:hypothetical protein
MFRPLFVLKMLLTISSVCVLPEIAAAQEPEDRAVLNAKMTAPPSANWQPAVPVGPAVRGPALPWLYVSLIGLQAYDGYSTNRGLNQGAVESNSFMSGLTSHPGALWAAKGGAAFVSIYTTERLWRRHRRGQAIALMLMSNGIMAAVAVSNASVLRVQR